MNFPGAVLNLADYAGLADHTPVIQSALDATASATWKEVRLSAGRWQVAGSLSMPDGAVLRGAGRGFFASGYPETGTFLGLTGGKGNPDGPAGIEAGSYGALSDLTLWNPNQLPSDRNNGVPDPYPFAVRGTGAATIIERLYLLDCYQGIEIACGHNWVRDVDGFGLRVGLRVRNVYDFLHLERICLGGLYDGKTQARVAWINANAIGFHILDNGPIFATGLWGGGQRYGILFEPRQTADGPVGAYGTFRGGGIDSAVTPLAVKALDGAGVRFVGFQFGSGGDYGVELDAPGFVPLHLLGCTFWAQKRAAVVQKSGNLAVAECYFGTPSAADGGASLVRTTAGALLFERNLAIVGGVDAGVMIDPKAVTACVRDNAVLGGRFKVTDPTGAAVATGGNVLVSGNFGS